MGGIGALNYTNGMIKRYKAYMEGILKYAITEIDGDDLEECVESGEISEKYKKTQDALDRIKENYQIEYIYIVKPLNTDNYDNMMNVMAGATEYEKNYEQDTIVSLGQLTGEAYSSNIAAEFMNKMQEENDSITFFSNRTLFGNDYTGFVPISNSKGEHIAVLAVDISISEIGYVLFRYLIVIFIAMILLSGVFVLGIYRWLRNRVVVPISQIQMSAESFVRSSHGQKNPEEIVFNNPNIQSNDEIQELSEALVTMASDLKTYMKNLLIETSEKERIGAELNLAQSIQADMLPCIFPAFPGRSEFDIYATMNPAKEVGGDFYDFFLVDDNHIAMVMADVSGKGVPAALFMVIAKTLIKNRTLMGGTPSEILEYVNNQLCEGNKAELFVTVWMAILDISTGKGTAANAGHEHPVIKRVTNGDGKYEYVKYRHSPAVATMEGLKFRQHDFELNPGDVLYVYTDGVLEATNADNELYGEERLLKVLNGNSDKNIEEILHEVKADVDKFVGSAPQFDDITMLGFEYYGK
jgi:sigma-B regulation protein RsbU (phosphoserine phosphatase)